MKTPPIGVPARAPNDMNINSVPIRAPILSMGEIIVMQACAEKRDGIVDGWLASLDVRKTAWQTYGDDGEV